jgi:type IV pilus biogenesis protein CpaD/CtpE
MLSLVVRATGLRVLVVTVLLVLVAACTSTDGDSGQAKSADSSAGAPLVADTSVPDPTAPAQGQYPTVDPAAVNYGDDATLDGLWDQCAEGSGQACDDLYWLAPLGSACEEFGYTCGDRDNIVLCSELDE